VNKNLKKGLQIFLFFSVGFFIFWWVSKDQDLDELKRALIHADYKWIWLCLAISILSHVSRALRWNILIASMGYKSRPINTLFAVLIMYLSNMAVPRSGEVVRCGVLTKMEDIPFTKLLGTVFVERVIDLIMLLLLLVVILFTQMHVVTDMLNNNPEIKENIRNMASSNTVTIGIPAFFILCIVVVWLFRARLKKTKIYQKIRTLLHNFAEGVKTIYKMKRKFEFIGHSIFIYLMYFLMIYFAFYIFDFTEHLTLLTGLTVFVMSSFGMVAPSPGGMGTWHFMAIQTLIIYGVSETDAYAFAITSHTTFTILMIILGVLSIILLPIVNKEKNKPEEVK
jgi:uncharacterized protein (TIRG00374 family)